MDTQLLPQQGYPLRTVEKVLGWKPRTAYAKMHRGVFKTYRDDSNRIMVAPWELYRLMAEQQEQINK